MRPRTRPLLRHALHFQVLLHIIGDPVRALMVLYALEEADKRMPPARRGSSKSNTPEKRAVLLEKHKGAKGRRKQVLSVAEQKAAQRVLRREAEWRREWEENMPLALKVNPIQALKRALVGLGDIKPPEQMSFNFQ